jgi:hypothetical protein
VQVLDSLLIALIAVALNPSGSTAGPALQPTSPPGGGYTVLLPSGWRFGKLASTPGKTIQLWYDPANPHARVLVTLSRCVLCVTKNSDGRTPSPQRALPPHVSMLTRINRWQITYTTPPTPGGYPDRGSITLTHRRTKIGGYARIDASLPTNLQATSTAILASFHLSGS